MYTMTPEAAQQEAKSEVAALYRFIPIASTPAPIEKLDYWLQSTYPERVEQFVKVLCPAFGQTLPMPLKATSAPVVEYHRRTPYLVLDQQYWIECVEFLVSMNTKPFTVQFFVTARDSENRYYLLEVGCRSPFKKDLIPAATRYGLMSK